MQLHDRRFQRDRAQAMLFQQTQQRGMGKETQVGIIEQPLGPIAEIARQQFGDHPSVGHIRHRQQRPSLRCQQSGQLCQHCTGLAQMLQNIGADDEIVKLARETFGQSNAFEIGTLQVAVPRCRLSHCRRVIFDAIHRTTEGLAQITTQHTWTGTQIQYPAARSNLTGNSSQRILTFRVQGTVINVGGRNDRHDSRFASTAATPHKCQQAAAHNLTQAPSGNSAAGLDQTPLSPAAQKST